MDAPELFRKVLRNDLAIKGRGSQKELAEAVGIGVKHLSAFMCGKQPLSEHLREKIANKLGYEYARYLIRGLAEEPDSVTSYEIKNLLGKATIVLESGTRYSESLKSNIISFFDGVKAERDLAAIKKRLGRRKIDDPNQIPDGIDRRKAQSDSG